MRPNKIGQEAMFHALLRDENANQLCVVLEIIEDENAKEHTVTLSVN